MTVRPPFAPRVSRYCRLARVRQQLSSGFHNWKGMKKVYPPPLHTNACALLGQCNCICKNENEIELYVTPVLVDTYTILDDELGVLIKPRNPQHHKNPSSSSPSRDLEIQILDKIMV